MSDYTEPVNWHEYVLCYEIFEKASDDTPRSELRQQMSDAVKAHRGHWL